MLVTLNIKHKEFFFPFISRLHLYGKKLTAEIQARHGNRVRYLAQPVFVYVYMPKDIWMLSSKKDIWILLSQTKYLHAFIEKKSKQEKGTLQWKSVLSPLQTPWLPSSLSPSSFWTLPHWNLHGTEHQLFAAPRFEGLPDSDLLSLLSPCRPSSTSSCPPPSSCCNTRRERPYQLEGNLSHSTALSGTKSLRMILYSGIVNV